ncbi:MAG: polymerase subunit gamma/tau [Bacteroidetes bacterium]|jgi:DNA polymerase-3 subunit gamma/tau|nr:polymerase subunit gamma/tau [Bacteroidota bacterium]
MDDFIVSARKYRPQHFNTVVGQGHITNTLKQAIKNGKIAQAYLFCGPRGVGKTTCARIFAKTINCTNLTSDGEACDACESCLSFNSGASLNVYELDAASNNSVEDIRNLVDQVRFAPQLGDYKVYVIDEVHMLSNAAFNAFLKTLEEPPKHAKFILATTEKHKIIPTILSRCQVFSFNRIKTEDITEQLVHIANTEQITFEPEALQIISQKADGGLRDACSIFDQMVTFTGNHLTYKAVVENLHVLDYEYYFKLTDAALNGRLPEVMVTFDEILKQGFDGHNFIIGFGEHLRNLLVSKDQFTVQLLEASESLKQRFAQQAQLCPIPFLLKSLAVINKCDIHYKAAKNQRLQVEMALMQISYLNTASQDAEKKNELNPEFGTQSAPKALEQAVTPAKFSAQPVVQTSSKPVVGFTELKIKSQFMLQNNAQHNQTIAVEANVLNDPQESFDVELTTDRAMAAVKQFAEEKNKNGNKQLYATLTSSKITLVDKTILIELNNEVQKEMLVGIKQDMLDDLRKLASNRQLQLEIKVSEIVGEIKAYKPADKFKLMAEKNPALLELKKRFDLDIEY